MPISKEKMKLYPGGSIHSKEWQEIRERIGKRSGWKCEACKVSHGEMVCRGIVYGRAVYVFPAGGEAHDEETGEFLGNVHLYDIEKPRDVKIILTVAHIDGDETHNDDSNLAHWCQLHHNRHDAAARQKNAADTRRAKNAAGDLFDGI